MFLVGTQLRKFGIPALMLPTVRENKIIKVFKYTNLRMLITSLTACTATSYSLSSVIETILSLNLLVNNSSLLFNSSDAYKG